MAALRAMRHGDLSDQGRAFGYVYNAGPEVAAVQRAAVAEFASMNGLDPTAYPSLRQLEREVVDWCLGHVNAPATAVGTFTSGGTESCMLAVKAAREWARTRDVTHPQIVVPETGHAAFHKGAHYLDVELVPVPVNAATFAVSPRDVRNAITKNTALIVGSAPGYAHGVVDPIEELGQLAAERELLLHVDGCIGGFLLPLYEALGESIPRFDFRVPGVTSISMDLHKYAFAPKGASVLLFREAEHRRQHFYACARWSGYSVVNTTIQSTKSGAPLAGAWAVMRFLGKAGYLQIAKEMLTATKKLIAAVEALNPLRVLGEPQMGLVAVASEKLNVFELSDALTRRGWYTQAQFGYGQSPRNLHLLVDPANARHVDAFIDDLRHVVDEAAAAASRPAPSALLQLAAAMTPQSLRENFDQMLSMLGARDASDATSAEFLKERAVLNEVIDALQPETKEALLVEFFSRLFDHET